MSEHHPLEGGDYRVERLKTEIKLRLNPKIRSSTVELGNLAAIGSQLDIKKLPKILQLKVGNREYTSIRKVEGKKITTQEFPNPEDFSDPYVHVISYKINSEVLGDGMVGVLFIPTIAAAMPKDKNLVDFIGSQEYTGYYYPSSLIAMTVSKGRPLRPGEWRLRPPVVSVIKKEKGEFFRLPLASQDREPVALRVKPDSKGRLSFFSFSYWWFPEEIQAQREFDNKLARFYVMVEGKSEQERQEEPGGARKLEPRLSEVIS